MIQKARVTSGTLLRLKSRVGSCLRRAPVRFDQSGHDGQRGLGRAVRRIGIWQSWTLHEAGTAALRRSRAQCGLFSGRAYPDRSVRALHAGHAGSGFVPTIRTPGVFRVLTPMRICGVPGTGGTGAVGWPGDVPAEAARTVIHLFQFASAPPATARGSCPHQPDVEHGKAPLRYRFLDEATGRLQPR